MVDVHDERCLSQRALPSEGPSQIKKTVFEGVRPASFWRGGVEMIGRKVQRGPSFL